MSKRWLGLFLLPGWIIPRIIETLAFLAAPNLPGLIALLFWWIAIPFLWLVLRWRHNLILGYLIGLGLALLGYLVVLMLLPVQWFLAKLHQAA